ncbi:MAG: HlyD family efflux transporter periplasmic adaptor subunit, partial [Actinomycetota bacterium]
RRIEYLQAKKAEGEGVRQFHKLRTELQALRQKVQEVEKKRSQYLSDRRARLSAQLEEYARKLTAAKKQLAKYEEARRLVQLVAPFNGIITSITQKAPGTMIEAGEVLVAMVPIGSRLRAAVDVMPSDIAGIHVGAPVTIKLDSLPFIKHGVLRGRVELITNDVDERTVTGQRDTVFRSWISIESDQLRDKPETFSILPGMTLEANIKTKERTVLSYLIYPITRGLSRSLIEP